MCDLALGRPVTRIGAKGQREKLAPNVDQMQAAQKLVVERLVAAVRSSEITGKDGAALIPQPTEPPDTRQLARVVLGILSHAKTDEADCQIIHDERTSKMSALPPKAHITQHPISLDANRPFPEGAGQAILRVDVSDF